MAPLLVPLALALAREAAPAVAGKVAAWIGGDESGKVAEQVVKAAVDTTGADTPEAALERIRADGELRLRFEEALLARETELERLYLRDRQDARERDARVRALSGGHNRRGDLLATIAIGGLIGLVYLLFTQEIPQGAYELLLVLSGTLASLVKDVYAFEFGSSRGSKVKDEKMAEVIRDATTRAR